MFVLLASLACGPGALPPASEHSFGEIRMLVRGKSATEVEYLLGAPDTRQAVFNGDERWIWWSYTYLDGPSHPPELRGKTVHLEMVFRNPGKAVGSTDRSVWIADELLSPAYRLPGALDTPLRQ